MKLLLGIVADIWSSRELIQTLFTRDLKAQYRQSVLGYAWIFVPTLCTTLLWAFLSAQNLIKVEDTPVPYPVYVLVGTMLWSAFAAGVTQPLASFQASSPVFTKLRVPPEAFIVAGLAQVLFDAAIRTFALIPVYVIYGMALNRTMFLYPIALLSIVIFGTAIGVFLIPIGSLYRDVSRTVTVFLGFGMYLVPVLFPPPSTGVASAVINVNPVTAFIMTGRDWLTVGTSAYSSAMFLWTGVSLLGILFGLVLLRAAVPHLIVRMGM